MEIVEAARIYTTQAGNRVIILIDRDFTVIGMSIPEEDCSTLRKDIKRLKAGDIPLTASVMSPRECYEFASGHDPVVTLYSDDTVKGIGVGERYYDG